jgi:hypothetical protein
MTKSLPRPKFIQHVNKLSLNDTSVIWGGVLARLSWDMHRWRETHVEQHTNTCRTLGPI